ncbi:PGF-CTERM sorting domain-containing protein [Natronobacterium gregoryi]|uniref:PGF-CTERM archaeal protein-sorting signal n=2 Tax=Natronobacterium gregoryi TaxID=44930 RepID=L0AE49_NATGS|nr:PGF-CTERM sorting domain-containing protein [Natronobacterium gregoryi]AFZ71427.1 PGF-CTERM archaeal protein-sorting signal [Natronobacterium gregoryi SP2]ELY66951.1 hypothetical protein C490_11963 [Natronobacterium gregoryi SP2]PLK21194.1 PGF-CTERM sorting domain-containing protein [Natronobacterium gregoryi SP2]SFI84134.1 PGF-CTERM protein [Natronobacterium gregoryi]
MQVVDNLRATGSEDNRTTTRIAGYLLATIAVLGLLAFLSIGLVAVGAAEETDDGPEQYLEENVTKESSDDPLEIEVAFAADFDDSELEVAEADVIWYDADEYANASDDAEVVESAVIDGEEGQTLAETFDRNDYGSLEFGDEYAVVVDGDDYIDDVARLDGGFVGGIGGADGSPGFGVVVAIAALAAAVGLAARGQ